MKNPNFAEWHAVEPPFVIIKNPNFAESLAVVKNPNFAESLPVERPFVTILKAY